MLISKSSCLHEFFLPSTYFLTRNELLILHTLDLYEQLLDVVGRKFLLSSDSEFPCYETNGPMNLSLIKSFMLFYFGTTSL